MYGAALEGVRAVPVRPSKPELSGRSRSHDANISSVGSDI
jgi:hypothetical protein